MSAVQPGSIAAVARAALLSLTEIGYNRRDLFGRFELLLAELRCFVPEQQWVAVVVALKDMRVAEERAEQVRKEAERQFVRALERDAKLA